MAKFDETKAKFEADRAALKVEAEKEHQAAVQKEREVAERIAAEKKAVDVAALKELEEAHKRKAAANEAKDETRHSTSLFRL